SVFSLLALPPPVPTSSCSIRQSRRHSHAVAISQCAVHARQVVHLHPAGIGVLTPDRVVNLLAMNLNLARCVDTQSHLVATNVHDGDFNVITDHDRLVPLTRKHQHVLGSFRLG